MNTNDSSGSRPFAANFQLSFAHVKLFRQKFGVNFKHTENYSGVDQKKVTQVIVNEMAIQCYAVARTNGATSLPALQVSHEYAIVSSGCLRSAMIFAFCEDASVSRGCLHSAMIFAFCEDACVSRGCLHSAMIFAFCEDASVSRGCLHSAMIFAFCEDNDALRG